MSSCSKCWLNVRCPLGFNLCLLQTHSTTLTLIFSENICLKSVSVWENVSAGLQGHHVYGEWLASLHKIFVDAACSSSELSTAPRDVFAFPLGKWEPSSNQKTSFHFLVLFTPFPSCSHSNALSACYFAFPSVSKLVWSQFLIPRVFPKILQLIGCNCEVIVLLGLTIYNVDLGMPWGLPILQGTEKLRFVLFLWYMKYSDSLYIMLLLTYRVILYFKFRMDSSKHDNDWVSNVM